MKYVIADKTKAIGSGFDMATHASVKSTMVLTEKELMFCPALSGTLEERAESVGGTLVGADKAREYIKKGGWQ